MANSDTFVIKLPATHRPHTFVKAVQPQIPFRYTKPDDVIRWRGRFGTAVKAVTDHRTLFHADQQD